MLLELPTAVYTSLISDWLTFGDVGKLDCAVSNRKYRLYYLAWVRQAAFHRLSELFFSRKHGKDKNSFFGPLSWLQSRLGSNASRISLTVTIKWREDDFNAKTSCWYWTHCFPFVQKLCFLSGYLTSNTLSAIFRLFPSLHTISMVVEDERSVDNIQALISQYHRFAQVKSMKVNISFSPICVPLEITREFLRLFASKIREGHDIDIHLALEYCRHFSSFGRKFGLSILEGKSLWGLASQLSDLEEFYFDTFYHLHELDSSIMLPSITQICSAYPKLKKIDFYTEKSAMRHIAELFCYSRTVEEIKAYQISWQRHATNTSAQGIQYTSELHLQRVLSSEECDHLRDILSAIPTLVQLHIMIVFEQYGEANQVATALVDLLLPHVSHVHTLTTTFIPLMVAEAYMLKSLGNFHSLESMKIVDKQNVSETMRSLVREDFYNLSDTFAGSVPKLKHLHLEGFQEDVCPIIGRIVQFSSLLHSLHLTKLPSVDDRVLDYLCQQESKRVWNSLVFESCLRISLSSIYTAIRERGLQVMQLHYFVKPWTYVAPGSHFKPKDVKLGYGRVPIVLLK